MVKGFDFPGQYRTCKLTSHQQSLTAHLILIVIDLDGVSLRVVNPLVLAIGRNLPFRIRSENHVGILHDLSEEERLLVVRLLAATWGIDILDSSETAARPSDLIDGDEGLPSPILVLFMVVRLNVFRIE